MSSKVSKSSLSIQKKWEDAAKKMGGKDTKIIVVKSLAKPLIYKVLLDSYRPMNITELYMKLKATVPSPLLTTCLDQMIYRKQLKDTNEQDSDDDFDNDFVPKKTFKKLSKKKKNDSNSPPQDQYNNSILVKVGRHAKSTLYYINQSVLQNNGNGSDPCDRSKNLSAFQRQTDELNKIQMSIQNMIMKTDKLCSEMKNEEVCLAMDRIMEEILLLEKDRDEAKVYAANEGHRMAVKKGTNALADHWRKRKRKCMDFLCMMEECSDGIMTVKKCLSGNGQIEIDSDEGIIKDALSVRKRARHCKIKTTSPVITDAIIGVVLEADGSVRRITCNSCTRYEYQ